MTETIPATPGWVEARLDAVFARLPDHADVRTAIAAYATCLAEMKSPAAPSDDLGAEFNRCRPALHRSLVKAGIGPELAAIDAELEALEAEIASDS